MTSFRVLVCVHTVTDAQRIGCVKWFRGVGIWNEGEIARDLQSRGNPNEFRISRDSFLSFPIAT